MPGRKISDNVIIYWEVLHTMRKKTGSTRYVIAKIDLEKAYDRLSWDFNKDTLVEVGLSSNWVRNIMECIQTSHLALLWNGD